MQLAKGSIERIKEAFAGSDFGDPRRGRRLDNMLEKLARSPGASLPDAMGTEADLEGAYRFVNNRSLAPQLLLQAYAYRTAQNAKDSGPVLVIHDTTTCSFVHAAPEQVGYLSTGKAGFLVHCSLVIESDTWRRPLGVAHVETIVRKQLSKRGRKNKAPGSETARWKNRESLRWERGVEASANVLTDCEQVCHIADREGDSYAFLAYMTANSRSFVVRVNHDRKVGDPDDLARQWLPLKEHVRSLDGLLEREVALSERKQSSAPRNNKTHPVRRARVAKLRFSATTVVLKRPRYLQDPITETLTLNVVHVTEPSPPQGEPPVEWLLFTTLPIDSADQVAMVVDNYRARWTIEEFNKALKTGCAYESREFETFHALHMILAISLPIACELLWLRSKARTDPNAPATDVVTPQQIEIMRSMGSRRLPPNPNAHDALWAVAGLGGHQKRNGAPGWLVLYRGMQALLAYEKGYEAGLKVTSASSRLVRYR